MNTSKIVKKYFWLIGYLLCLIVLIPFISFGQEEVFEEQTIGYQSRKAKEHFYEQKYQEAFSLLKKVIKEDEKDYTLWLDLSVFAIYASKPEEAIAAALKTKELTPKEDNMDFVLALGYLLNDQWSKAEAIFLERKGQIVIEEEGLTWERAFLFRMAAFEQAGIRHINFEKVTQMIGATATMSIDKWLKWILPKSNITLDLDSLILERKQLTVLPKGIGRLQNLTSLNLGFNQLTELPSEIGELQKLSNLDLNRNDLIELPSEIGQ